MNEVERAYQNVRAAVDMNRGDIAGSLELLHNRAVKADEYIAAMEAAWSALDRGGDIPAAYDALDID